MASLPLQRHSFAWYTQVSSMMFGAPCPPLHCTFYFCSIDSDNIKGLTKLFCGLTQGSYAYVPATGKANVV